MNITLTPLNHLPDKSVLISSVSQKAFIDEILSADVWDKFNSASADLFVIPVNTYGELLWDRLPVEIARLVRSPLHSSVMLISSEQARHLGSEREVLKYLIDADSKSVHVLPAIKLARFQPEFPELAPQAALLPDFLESAIEKQPQGGVTSSVEATALKAGLFLVNDALDQSHTCSQSIEGEGLHHEGDYWHAIMHRREPDYGNSKYWFRRVGQHPVFKELLAYVNAIIAGSSAPQAEAWKTRLCDAGWDPFAFVDLAQQCGRDESSVLAAFAREIQWAEMLLLLAHNHAACRN